MTPDQIRGGMWGLLIGDAAGVPYEFMDAASIAKLAPGAPGFDSLASPIAVELRAHKVSHGTWSDDGAQALALADSLVECGRFDPDDFAHRLIRWRFHGAYTPDGVVFDCGVHTSQALNAIRRRESVEVASRGRPSLGNGSLMRTLPLALWHRGTNAELVRDARAASAVTHYDPVAQDACALYCLLVRELRVGRDMNLGAASTALHRFGALTGRGEILRDMLRPPMGSGHVLDSLAAALDATTAATYASAVRSAIAMGNDTDTTAAIVGGLVGARDGLASIPRGWLDTMRGAEVAAPIIERLVQVRS